MLSVVFKYVREGYKEEMDFHCGWIKSTVFLIAAREIYIQYKKKTSAGKET